MTNFWRISLAVSIVANCAAVTAVGLRLKKSDLQKNTVAAKQEPSRLVEIRMMRTEEAPKPKLLRQKKSVKVAENERRAHSLKGELKNGASAEDPAEINNVQMPKSQLSDTSAAPGSAKPVKVNARARLHGSATVELAVPKPGVYRAYNGVLDLRNSKIKITLHADPNKIPKDLLNKPNKVIGTPKLEYIGGKPKSTAICVGKVGGSTVYASHLKIIGAKNIEISGTKFCGPGGLPLPLGSGSQGNDSKSKLVPKGVSQTSGEAFVIDPHQAALNKNWGELASGPANFAAEGVQPFQDGPVPGIAGEIRPPHLPDIDEDLNAPLKEEQKPREEQEKPEKLGPQPNLGSLSEGGEIPWGPIKSKPKHGLLADFYEGRNFEKYLFTRRTPHVNYRWTGQKVDRQLPLGVPYSVRWSGFIRPRYSETYKLYTCSDDGVRLYVNGQLLIDNWTNHADSEDVCAVQMEAGKDYAMRLEYYEANGLTGQVIKLYWESPSQVKEYVPERCLLYSR
ncbi:MAG TPA: PA14 domain-containing protein [Fimbriimonadaceae bacterium]|jgi:hypothetical protein